MARKTDWSRWGTITVFLLIIVLAGWMPWSEDSPQLSTAGLPQRISKVTNKGWIDCSSRLLPEAQQTTGHSGSFTLDKNGMQLEHLLQDLYQDNTEGSSEVMQAVFAEDLFLLRVLQQGPNGPYYVSHQVDSVTQFDLTSKYGTVGLLAHNDHSGRLFVQLKRGQRILLVYGNGCTERFTVTDYLKYQAITADDPYTNFKDLRSGNVITNSQIFREVYKGERHITFQTCIAAEGNPSWGRLFVIAEPINSTQY